MKLSREDRAYIISRLADRYSLEMASRAVRLAIEKDAEHVYDAAEELCLYWHSKLPPVYDRAEVERWDAEYHARKIARAAENEAERLRGIENTRTHVRAVLDRVIPKTKEEKRAA